MSSNLRSIFVWVSSVKINNLLPIQSPRRCLLLHSSCDVPSSPLLARVRSIGASRVSMCWWPSIYLVMRLLRPSAYSMLCFSLSDLSICAPCSPTALSSMEMGLWRKPCTASVCANNGDTSRRRHLEVLSVLLPAGAASFILGVFCISPFFCLQGGCCCGLFWAGRLCGGGGILLLCSFRAAVVAFS